MDYTKAKRPCEPTPQIYTLIVVAHFTPYDPLGKTRLGWLAHYMLRMFSFRLLESREGRAER